MFTPSLSPIGFTYLHPPKKQLFSEFLCTLAKHTVLPCLFLCLFASVSFNSGASAVRFADFERFILHRSLILYTILISFSNSFFQSIDENGVFEFKVVKRCLKSAYFFAPVHIVLLRKFTASGQIIENMYTKYAYFWLFIEYLHNWLLWWMYGESAYCSGSCGTVFRFFLIQAIEIQHSSLVPCMSVAIKFAYSY